jgi:predicted nucleic acid-binding protein
MVLDASAVVEWLLRLPLASAVSERLLAADALHAPHLLADLDVIHHPHEPLLPVMWRLRSNLTAYDAAFVAVAEVLDRPPGHARRRAPPGARARGGGRPRRPGGAAGAGTVRSMPAGAGVGGGDGRRPARRVRRGRAGRCR